MTSRAHKHTRALYPFGNGVTNNHGVIIDFLLHRVRFPAPSQKLVRVVFVYSLEIDFRFKFFSFSFFFVWSVKIEQRCGD